jgi:hypothetical protein
MKRRAAGIEPLSEAWEVLNIPIPFSSELGRAGVYYKRPRPDDSLFLIFMMGLVFLAIAVLNSMRLISKMQDLQDIAKK